MQKVLHTRKNQKEKNSVFFLESSFGQQQSAHKKQREIDRPKKIFSISLSLSPNRSFYPLEKIGAPHSRCVYT
jgi:hypothetical protein